MRIGVDNISPGESTSRNGPGGMRMYLQSLVTRFAEYGSQFQFVILSPDWSDDSFENIHSNVKVVRLHGVPTARAQRIIYQQIVLPNIIAQQNLDVFFATATVAPLFCSTPTVLAVQFIQFYRWPKTYGAMRTAYLKLVLPWSLRKAFKSIIFTASAKEDLIRWTGVSSAKVEVVPHGLSPIAKRLSELPSDAPERQIGLELTDGRPYIVYVSATYEYKNHRRLIQAFSLLKKRHRMPHVLLLVGSEVTVSYNELCSTARDFDVTNDVVIAGHVTPDERALSTYLSADIAVIPTLYETFGFPVLEAMACGCPVVTSNYGAMAELAGDAAILVDPSSIESIARGIEQVLGNSDLRRSLIERGRERAAIFTWERSAMRTLEILQEANQG